MNYTVTHTTAIISYEAAENLLSGPKLNAMSHSGEINLKLKLFHI